MNIAVVTTSIALGGITSYLIPFVNFLCSRGHEITVFYTNISDEKRPMIDNRIRLIKFSLPKTKSFRETVHLALSGGAISMLRIKFRNRNKVAPIVDVQRLNYLFAKQTSPFEGNFDIAISSAEFLCNYLALLKINALKKIAWIHPDLSLLEIDKKLSKKVLSSFDDICVVSDSCYLSFAKIFPEFVEKTHVIENIINQSEIIKKSEEAVDESLFPHSKIKIITVCRFDNSSKRLDRIVNACKLLKHKNIEFIWNLIGTGPDADYIQRLAAEADVLDVLRFLGSKSNPYPYIARSDVFVLSSQYEGKPIVVDEALALRVPCIVTNYRSAKKQVPYNYGAVLDNDDDSFSAALLETLDEKNIIEWKNNLLSYTINNAHIEEKIDKLIRK